MYGRRSASKVIFSRLIGAEMGFWDIAGKVGKGVAGFAWEVVKELPSAMVNQAGRNADKRLKSDTEMTSERREKLEEIVSKSKSYNKSTDSK